MKVEGRKVGNVRTRPYEPPEGFITRLVEGETLADRIARGPIPLTDALALARQVADALDAAHEKSIAHRDLKPANIKITPEGVVGLAKAMSGDGRPLT